jgi:hypothetical protein
VYESDNNEEHLHKPPETNNKFQFIPLHYTEKAVIIGKLQSGCSAATHTLSFELQSGCFAATQTPSFELQSGCSAATQTPSLNCSLGVLQQQRHHHLKNSTHSEPWNNLHQRAVTD